MKRHANLLCLGAAVALLNACAPAVNAPEPVFGSVDFSWG